MKRFIKWSLIALPIVLIAIAGIIIGGSYLEHQTAIEEDMAYYPAPGERIDIHGDGHAMHVHGEGKGGATVVFLAGFGTPSPFYDFQAIRRALPDGYRTVVVERFGYGWSDVTDHGRDIDTVTDETRAALKEAGEEGPFILAGHSMASIEALHWAQTYPEEVTAMIGLDPLVPAYYEEHGEEPDVSGVVTFLARSGLMRQQPDVFHENFHAMAKGLLDDDDAEAARSVFNRRVQTANMADEAEKLTDNVRTVQDAGTPDAPFFAAIASGNHDGQPFIEALAEETGGDSRVFEGGHYIHLDQPEAIAEQIDSWMQAEAGSES